MGRNKSDVFLLYNDRLYSGSQHPPTRQNGKAYDNLKYLRDRNIDALKAWLVERIANHLHMGQQEEAIKTYLNYKFK